MALARGGRLGPYEIIGPLGAGGMGEVYKARDTRLDRTVAIKILPEAVAADPQRRERFRREARAISTLSHPHICTLHDIGEHDGVEFLVMEYLPGETLAQRLLRGPLPIAEVVRIGADLAEALDAAHRQGLVHRDLKPSNVMLTPGGATILDFGLATWQRREVDPLSASAAATGHSTLTQTGTIAGTIQYMAPEQVEGKPADARTDIFALGAILHEMTTGRTAFERSSAASVPLTPPVLDHVVKTCLAKNPDERWQNASDVARELKWIAETMSQPALSVSDKADSKHRSYFWIGASAVFALTTTLLVLVILRKAPVETSQVRLFIPPPEHAAYASYNQIESPPVVSPDGKRIAFVAHQIGRPDSVWVRSLDTLTARELPGTDGVPASSLRPFWSPDGRSLGFFAGGKLKRVDIAGGPPQELADAPDARGGTWSELGVIVFAPSSDGPLYRISAKGGAVTAATKLRPPETGHRWPVFLPDGRHFLYLRRTLPAYSNSSTDVASLDSTDVKRVLDFATSSLLNVAYAPTGHLLFVRGGTLFAQPFDPTRLVLTGEPTAIVEHVGHDSGIGATFSISTNGVLVYRKEAAPVSSQLVWLDRSGRSVGVVGNAAKQDGVALSPDGSHVAVQREEPGRSEIWILSVTTGAASRFTLENGNYSPVWSSDGRHIAFGKQHHESGRVINGVFRKVSTGTGEVEALVHGQYSTNPTDWSRDGRFIVYADQDVETKMDLWALAVSGDRTPIPLVQTAGWDGFGQVSPDGRWLAYTSDVSGREEVYVQAFPAARGKWQISLTGGTQPRWGHDIKELFYISPDRHLVAVPVKAGPESFETGVQKQLFAVPTVAGQDYAYDVDASGRRFLVNTVVSDTSQPIVVVLNWAADLKR